VPRGSVKRGDPLNDAYDGKKHCFGSEIRWNSVSVHVAFLIFSLLLFCILLLETLTIYLFWIFDLISPIPELLSSMRNYFLNLLKIHYLRRLHRLTFAIYDSRSQTNHSFERRYTGGAKPKKKWKREEKEVYRGTAVYISRGSAFIDSLNIPISARDMSTAPDAVDRHRVVQEFVTRCLSIGPCELPEIVDPSCENA